MFVSDKLFGAIDRSGSGSSIGQDLNGIAPRMPAGPFANQSIQSINIGDAVGVCCEAKIAFEFFATDDIEDALGD